MAKSLEPLKSLGQSVAVALEAAAPERGHAIEAARRNFMLTQLGARSRSPRIFAGPNVWAGGVALALVTTVVLVLAQRRAALTFQVDGAPGLAKTWLAAPGSAPLRLSFSEGTSVRLEAASRARVADIDAHGASLSLESGSLHAEVVHQSDSAWKVVAGPFTVAVTGTVFDVNWDPNSEQLAVSVARGSVVVRDPAAGTEQVVHTAETLHTSSAGHRFELTAAGVGSAALLPAPMAADAAEPAAPEASATLAHDVASAAPEEAVEAPAPKDESPKTSQWREYAKRGALREAFASADAAGFAASCALATPADLLLLGDGARLSGKPDRAIEALLALRRRFPGDPRRAAAAFALGKVAFDQRGAYEQAAEWFSTSLREQPNGVLAREASGRLIEALRRADDSAGARRAARDYLAKYPEGPHADLARSVLH
jgi:transmembrane sensor